MEEFKSHVDVSPDDNTEVLLLLLELTDKTKAENTYLYSEGQLLSKALKC